MSTSTTINPSTGNLDLLGGTSIGDSIGSGTANCVLFLDSSGNLANSSNFKYISSTKTLTLKSDGTNKIVSLQDSTGTEIGYIATGANKINFITSDLFTDVGFSFQNGYGGVDFLVNGGFGDMSCISTGRQIWGSTNTRCLLITTGGLVLGAAVQNATAPTNQEILIIGDTNNPTSMRFKMSAGQSTTNPLIFQDSSGNVMSFFDKDGDLTLYARGTSSSDPALYFNNATSNNPIVKWNATTLSDGIKFYSGSTEIFRMQDNGDSEFTRIVTFDHNMGMDSSGIYRNSPTNGPRLNFGDSGTWMARVYTTESSPGAYPQAWRIEVPHASTVGLLVSPKSGQTADCFQVGDGGSTVLSYINAAGWIVNKPGIKRVSSQFDKTSNTTLANITGLSATLIAGITYAFEAVLFTTSNVAGGVKFAISGTATATAIIYEAVVMDAAVIAAQTRATSLSTAVGGVTAVTAAICRITGTITVNAAGTLTVQFAQNASNGTASSVLVGSYFIVNENP